MLDKSKLKLKTALHGLEIGIGRLINQIDELKSENAKLRAENERMKSVVPMNTSVLEKESNVKSQKLDMLDPNAVNSIDMSIKELKNMVKNQ